MTKVHGSTRKENEQTLPTPNIDLDKGKGQQEMAKCTHFLGYLKKRETSAFPDECLTCPRTLECMLG
jgi:hypothetical protein